MDDTWQRKRKRAYLSSYFHQGISYSLRRNTKRGFHLYRFVYSRRVVGNIRSTRQVRATGGTFTPPKARRQGNDMEKERIEEYKNRILPYYKEMANNPKVTQIDREKRLSFFCTQWGRNWHSGGILFVGRATNGWGQGINIDNLPFNEQDQMDWVITHGMNSSTAWRASRSPFWRVIKNVSQRFHATDWQTYIAWSNLCKCSFLESGNPSDSLFYATLEPCRQILKVDVEMLKPRAIVMLTEANLVDALTKRGWSGCFVDCLVDGVAPKDFSLSGCSVKVLDNEKYRIVVSERPEYRPELPRIECIAAAISERSLK